LGVGVPDGRFVSFDVDEASEAWPALKVWIERRRAADLATTRFSAEEFAEARWFELVPDWHYGFPQPNQDESGYLAATYDVTDYCERCGIGLKQKAPFQMKSEPKWGRNDLLQLNWIFDEYFAKPDVWATVFRPFGIGSRPVSNTKGAELKTVVQLAVEGEVGLVTDGLTAQKCATCGRVKYVPVTRGPFPPLRSGPAAAMVKTAEYFGSGAGASKVLIVSKALAQVLLRHHVRGVSLKPVSSF